MQARDREPLRCVQSNTPTHASSMPELPPPPHLAPHCPPTTPPPSPPPPSILTDMTTDTTDLCGNPVLTDPPTPTSRRVRFQADEAHATSTMPSTNTPGTPPLPGRSHVPRSRSLQPEEVASTSWGKFSSKLYDDAFLC